MTRFDLFAKLYDKLLEEGLIEENNFSDKEDALNEFLRITYNVFEDVYIMDQLHELN